MRELTELEVMEINGAGWIKFVLPVVIGFALGGPAGAIAAATTVVATTGVSNLEHLYSLNEIPSIDQIVE